MTITILGLGAMGSRIAERLLDDGEELTLFNRTPERMRPLIERGASGAASAREAASRSDVVISIVKDDEASRDLWLDPEKGALQGLRPGTIVLESSTLTPGYARELGRAMGEANVRFLDAPVVGSRPQADAGKLVYLMGGDPDVVDEVRPLLSNVAAAVHHVGEVGSGMTLKLVVNAMLALQAAALAELIGFLSKEEVELDRCVEILQSLPTLSPVASRFAGLMLGDDFSPNFPIELVAKDTRYVVETAREAGAELPVLAAVRDTFARGVDEGKGEEDIAGIVGLYRAQV